MNKKYGKPTLKITLANNDELCSLIDISLPWDSSEFEDEEEEVL